MIHRILCWLGYRRKEQSQTDLKQFDLRLWLRQVLEIAEKQGLSPEVMAQLRYKAEQTIMESERENRRLLRIMRECGIR